MTPTDVQHTPKLLKMPKDTWHDYMSDPDKAAGEEHDYQVTLRDEDDNAVATCCSSELATCQANARRLAACWNACQGVPTETLEAGCCKMTFEMPLGAPADPGSAELTFSVPRSNLVHVDVSDLPKPAPPPERYYPRPLDMLGTVHIIQCKCEEPLGPAGGVCDKCWNAILTDEERKQDATT